MQKLNACELGACMQASPTAIDEVEYAAAAHNPDPELPPLLDPPRPALQYIPELSRVTFMLRNGHADTTSLTME